MTVTVAERGVGNCGRAIRSGRAKTREEAPTGRAPEAAYEMEYVAAAMSSMVSASASPIT